jgi:hypothetical protein
MQAINLSSNDTLHNLLLNHHVNNLNNGVASAGTDHEPIVSPGIVPGKIVANPIIDKGTFSVPMAAPAKQPIVQKITSTFTGLFSRKAGQ